MKIVTGLATAQEVEPLIEAGADELFCGVVPEAFVDGLGRSRLNRRYEPGANFADLAELAGVVKRAAAKNVPVAVTLNEHAYAPALIPTLVELAGTLVAAGARALIVTDLALILAIRRAGIAVDLHLSSVATCYNSEAAAFFADIGIQRVILPRYLSTRQIARLCAAGVPVDYEVFVINDGCGFEEGLCLNVHRPFGPMCQMDWRPEVGPEPVAGWEENWRAYRHLMGLLDHPGGTVSPQGIPNGPCGVCALAGLKAAGVGYVKVPGREYSTALRLGGLRLVRTVLDWVEGGDPAEVVAERARALKDTPLLCDSTYLCYFRDDLARAKPGRSRPRRVTLDDLAAAARFQAPARDAVPVPDGSLAGGAAPPPAAAGTKPDAGDPDGARLLGMAEALAGKGIDLRWAGDRLELVFPDDAQPDGTSRVTVAKVDRAASCYARSGNLGLSYAGTALTPRIARLIANLVGWLQRPRA
ncbi:MAG: U32 family peptidase [Deltaproteobacteria bacterium]|nr:U32 family peptidase [Deltaproteobacteria bacterium]